MKEGEQVDLQCRAAECQCPMPAKAVCNLGLGETAVPSAGLDLKDTAWRPGPDL